MCSIDRDVFRVRRRTAASSFRRKSACAQCGSIAEVGNFFLPFLRAAAHLPLPGGLLVAFDYGNVPPRTQRGTTLGRPWAQMKGWAQAASWRTNSRDSDRDSRSPNLDRIV